MQKKIPKKRKIYRKTSDFYSPKEVTAEEDISFAGKPPSSPITLTIENFNNLGEISDLPSAMPSYCVAADIDPTYKIDGDRRQRFRKFLVKSDILKLRDIARTKFFLYTNQELALEMEREKQENQKIYKNVMQFYEFCFAHLTTVERNAFEEMQRKYSELFELRKNNTLEIENEKLIMRQQEMYTRVFHVYQKFRYLLKLIEYFDIVSEASDDITKFNRIINDEQMTSFLSIMPMKHSRDETEKLVDLMDRTIRPYLDKKRFMDAQVWEKGYQAIRRKMFNYNRHLTRVALLNHFTAIVFDKFMKHQIFRLTPAKKFQKNSKFLLNRTENLKRTTLEILDNWEMIERQNTLKPSIDGILPAMVRKLKLDKKPLDIPQPQDENTVAKLEAIRDRLLNLLYDLDALEPEMCKKIEKDVRKRTVEDQAASKQALVKQTRFKNLLEHYRMHYAKKGIVQRYRTFLRPYSIKKKTKAANAAPTLH